MYCTISGAYKAFSTYKLLTIYVESMLLLFVDWFTVQAGEKNKEDNLVDAIGEDEVQDIKNEEMVAVKEELTTLANNGTLDSYGHYL